MALEKVEGQVSILIWDVEAGQAIGQPLPAHTDDVHGWAFSPDGSLLAMASFGSVRLWDAERGAPLLEPLIAHDGRVLSVAFSPDGKTLASGGTDDLIYLWDTATGALAGPPLAGHGNWVRALLFSDAGKPWSRPMRTARSWSGRWGYVVACEATRTGCAVWGSALTAVF